MAYNPSWLPAWPSWAPDFETVYQYMFPAQFPDGLYSEDGEAYKDQQAFGIGFSFIRKHMWWVMERVWPWLDDDGLFLDRHEDDYGLEPTGSITTRQRRIVASMRNRGTLTERVIKSIFEWVFGTEDPDNVSTVSPTPANAWAASLCWQNIDWPEDVTIDIKAISGHGGNYIWGVGDSGLIRLYTTSWSVVASGTGNNLLAVWAEPGNSSFAWAAGVGPTIREWTGAAWGAGPAGGPAANIWGLWGCGRYYNTGAAEYQTRYMWTCGASDEVSRYDRSAAAWMNWTPGGSGTWRSIHAYAPDDVWACNDAGEVARWNGTAWTVTVVNAGEKFFAIRKMPDLKTYVVGSNGVCYWFSDEAGSWTALNTGVATDLNGLDGWSQDRMVAVGIGGVCIRFHGRFDASDWDLIRTGTSKTLRGVWISTQTVNAMIAGDDGTTKNSPPNDHAFVMNQNTLHIYSTAQDLNPDYGIGRDKCRLCQPAWGRFTVGRRRTLRASDSDGASGADNSVAA